MGAVSYVAINPSKTYTIDEFIACQSDETFCYNNLSFIDVVGYIHYNAYNVISDYVDELRDACQTVQLTEEQLYKYKYRPKLLCYDIYGNGELAPLILIINDMYSVKQFIKKKLLLPRKSDMATLTKQLFNGNRSEIEAYNQKNNTTYN